MKTFSCFNDDGTTVMVMAQNKKQAVNKTANKIAEIGLEIELDYFEDDINEAFISESETVSDWLNNNGIKFTENSMIIMEFNDIEQSAKLVNL